MPTSKNRRRVRCPRCGYMIRVRKDNTAEPHLLTFRRMCEQSGERLDIEADSKGDDHAE